MEREQPCVRESRRRDGELAKVDRVARLGQAELPADRWDDDDSGGELQRSCPRYRDHPAVLQLGTGEGGGTLAHRLSHQWPLFLSCFISFMNIGTVCLNHHKS
jgi:hypothetical protein